MTDRPQFIGRFGLSGALCCAATHPAPAFWARHDSVPSLRPVACSPSKASSADTPHWVRYLNNLAVGTQLTPYAADILVWMGELFKPARVRHRDGRRKAFTEQMRTVADEIRGLVCAARVAV
ncbi:hypothetical protein [Salinisphaera sp.]|uniref:hypothetical protein n=1 Tax=Salinisphaera sp. TaxID=1914330 RepID=UPI000C437512|nr:hypothetical protein [Salinisphaera sp.]MBS63997.1 hypothetical protein [Salinisphaera sp.]